MQKVCLIPSCPDDRLDVAIASAWEFDRILVWLDGWSAPYLATDKVRVYSGIQRRGVNRSRDALYHLAPSDTAIAYLDADDMRVPGLPAQMVYLIETGADFLYSPVLCDHKPLPLSQTPEDPIAVLLGQQLQTGGLIVRRRAIARMYATLGHLWRGNLRHEYWFMLDLLRSGAYGLYYPKPVSTYKPGDFTASITDSDRLVEYLCFCEALRSWIGGDRWSEYEHIALQVRTSLGYRLKKN